MGYKIKVKNKFLTVITDSHFRVFPEFESKSIY
jgi:hypothetical protein